MQQKLGRISIFYDTHEAMGGNAQCMIRDGFRRREPRCMQLTRGRNQDDMAREPNIMVFMRRKIPTSPSYMISWRIRKGCQGTRPCLCPACQPEDKSLQDFFPNTHLRIQVEAKEHIPQHISMSLLQKGLSFCAKKKVVLLFCFIFLSNLNGKVQYTVAYGRLPQTQDYSTNQTRIEIYI